MDASTPNEFTGDLQQQAAADAGVADTGQVEVEVKIAPPPKFVHTIRELIY
ncbi:MAG TPA: hypothetical protein VF261_01075 [Candidatus Saccharimonadales bacterium]